MQLMLCLKNIFNAWIPAVFINLTLINAYIVTNCPSFK